MHELQSNSVGGNYTVIFVLRNKFSANVVRKMNPIWSEINAKSLKTYQFYYIF